jgi:hypothetical protein
MCRHKCQRFQQVKVSPCRRSHLQDDQRLPSSFCGHCARVNRCSWPGGFRSPCLGFPVCLVLPDSSQSSHGQWRHKHLRLGCFLLSGFGFGLQTTPPDADFSSNAFRQKKTEIIR